MNRLPTAAPPASPRPGGAGERGPASTNTGLIRDSQFNDGGFGKVGLQFADVRVRGSVGVAMDSRLIESPQPLGNGGAIDVGPVPDGRPLRSADATNTGTIRRSQFNDGGFGDIGFQWSNVAVGRSVATSTNTLSIQPRSDGVGPITATDLVLGAGWPSPDASSSADAEVANVGGAVGPLAARRPGRAGAIAREIDATNSGLIRKSQFNDGGFGDVGLQWSNVRVAGSVAAVHNSLSIQPENAGQGLITVRNVVFPSRPAAMPAPRLGPGGRLDPTPPIIVEDGWQVGSPLPPRTRPYESFDRNAATNSGDVIDAQFNDGGFGDLGLQWRDVDVRGDVRIVHNSLSIQPEGSDLAGVSVSNVRFGGIAPASSADAPILVCRRSTEASRSDVFLQYDRASRGYGVVIVNNTLMIDPGANVTLEDVRFPQERPVDASPSPGLAALGRQGLDSATNSGVVKNRQFNDGGFGDVALPWRKVRVDGPVTVVHNTLSVDVTGSNTGPIDVSDVVFDSGLSGVSPGGSTPASSGVGGDAGHIRLRLRNARIRGPVTVVDNVLSVQAEGANTGPITISHVRYE